MQSATFAVVAVFLWFGAHEVLRAPDGGELVAFNALVLLANAPIAIAAGRVGPAAARDRAARPPAGRLRAGARAGRDRGAAPVDHARGPRAPAPASASPTPARPTARCSSDISLDVPPGTTVALVGRSGSGKSTLVKCLAGLLVPTEGTIHFDGRTCASCASRPAATHRLRAPGPLPLRRHDRPQHRLRRGGARPRARALGRASRRRARFVDALPLGYETRIGETACGCRAVRRSGSRSRARSTPARRC